MALVHDGWDQAWDQSFDDNWDSWNRSGQDGAFASLSEMSKGKGGGRGSWGSSHSKGSIDFVQGCKSGGNSSDNGDLAEEELVPDWKGKSSNRKGGSVLNGGWNGSSCGPESLKGGFVGACSDLATSTGASAKSSSIASKAKAMFSQTSFSGGKACGKTSVVCPPPMTLIAAKSPSATKGNEGGYDGGLAPCAISSLSGSAAFGVQAPNPILQGPRITFGGKDNGKGKSLPPLVPLNVAGGCGKVNIIGPTVFRQQILPGVVPPPQSCAGAAGPQVIAARASLPMTQLQAPSGLRPLALMQSGVAAPGPQLIAPCHGLAPELAALMTAEAGFGKEAPLPPHITEKKPRVILLITRLAPDFEEVHMQQLLEQCGEVQAWRRGRGTNGELLSFGFAQFGDPEAAWKVSQCLNKREMCGQEIKVLIEEQAESVINAWRSSQLAALKVSTEEELEWELERKAVSCKALIDAKLEEIFGGAGENGGGGPKPGGAVERRMFELQEKEQARVERVRKRKAVRDEEFLREMARIEASEKRLRREEQEKDDQDREREELESREKESHEEKLQKMEEIANTGGSILATASAVDSRALYDLVDRVQAEARTDLFQMELDVNFLRDEKVFEKKLRPWLERKVDFCMGGPQSDLVEYILRRVNAASYPDALINELQRFLDDKADPIAERMWRMLILELTRGGLGLSKRRFQ